MRLVLSGQHILIFLLSLAPTMGEHHSVSFSILLITHIPSILFSSLCLSINGKEYGRWCWDGVGLSVLTLGYGVVFSEHAKALKQATYHIPQVKWLLISISD